VSDDEQGILAFTRELDGQRVYVVLNRSAEDRTIKLPLNSADVGEPLYDYLNATQTELLPPPNDAPNARTKLRPRQGEGIGHLARTETLELRIPPFGCAVLAQRP
jgi:hypothetical protein